MKILHISDLHLKNKNNSLIDEIKNYVREEKFDLCFFTGDLVDKFKYPLDQAYDFIKTNLIDNLNIQNFFISCGNHDIDRKKAMPMFQEHLQKFKSIEEIDSFVIENKSDQFKSNLSHLQSFNQLIKDNYSPNTNSDLYSIHKVKIDQKNICIVNLNLSWSAFSSQSFGKIIFPPSIIDEISKKISSSDFNILISHYPLDFLSSICKRSIIKLIHKNFDCIFCGHSHEYDFNAYQFSDTGVFTCVSPATINNVEKENIGFVKLDIDLKQYTVNVINSIYLKDHFIDDKEHTFEIPKDDLKKNELNLFQHILSKRETFVEKATKLFVPIEEQENLTFLDIFTEPIIKDKDINDELVVKNVKKVIRSNKIDYSTLKDENNYLIFGNDKGGKTALLYKIMIDYLTAFSQLHTIPLYIDLKHYYFKNFKNIDFYQEIRNQYNLSNKLFNKIIKLYNIKILFDNMHPSNKEDNAYLFEIISKMERISFIILSSNIVKSNLLTLDGLKYTELFLTDISRAKIRELTYKWPIKRNHNPDEIVDKITKLFSQLHIHFNFWTVTMFLSILEKTDNIKLHSNSDLLDLYVEKILEKQKLALISIKSFSYDDYRIFLSHLAYFLYSKKELTNYSASYSEIVNCFEEFKKPFIRIIASSKDIIEYIIDKGILISLGSDSFTFRLNGVFEYFLAFYMFNNKGYLNSIIEDSNLFLSFKNELELYAGFVRDDQDLLHQIYCNTLDAYKLMQTKYGDEINYEEIISKVSSDLKPLLEIASEIKDEIVPISLDEQDSIQDMVDPITNIESKVKVKHKYNITKIDSDLYSEHLFILGRVFKNLDKVKDKELLVEIFQFLVDQSCMIIYFLINDFFEYIKEKDPSKKEINDLITDFNIFSPLLAHSFLFDIVNHPTLSQLIKDEINTLEVEPQKNQFKLFVLYFLLIESNLETEIDIVSKLIEISEFWNIQYSIFIKLLMFIAFKCDKNEKLCSTIKKYVEQIHKKMYPGRDKKNQPISNEGVINELIKNIQA